MTDMRPWVPVEDAPVRPAITTKRVQRWFAPYLSKCGIWHQKGFGSRMAAARFLAKQDLLDKVFGPKVAHYDNYTDEDFWFRDVPDEKAERDAMYAKAYPLELCDCGAPNEYGDFAGYQQECDDRGCAVCAMRRDLINWTNQHYGTVPK